MNLSGALVAARRLAQRVEDNPLRWVQWTPPQRAFHELQSKRKLFRAGNQIGKSWAVLAEAIWIASKTHPYQRPRPGPLEIWVVCTSWSQSVAIMRKFRELCPPEYVDDKRSSNFNSRSGYGKDNPAVVFLDIGPERQAQIASVSAFAYSLVLHRSSYASWVATLGLGATCLGTTRLKH